MTTLSPEQRKAIAQAALRTAREYQAQPVATVDELLAMEQADLDEYLAARGVVVDWEAADDAVWLQLGSEGLALDRNTPLTEARVERLKINAEKAVVTTARNTANKIMGDARQEAMEQADPRPPEERWLMWVSVGSGVCPDCRSLHGVPFRADFWVGHAPRDGQTLCGAKCRCSLVPCPSPGNANEGIRVEEARAIFEQ